MKHDNYISILDYINLRIIDILSNCMLRIILPIAAAFSVMAILFQMGFANLALAIAEPLIPINTGYQRYDIFLPYKVIRY
jgi:hypothetical protein